MDHADHVALLRPGIPGRDPGHPPVWADLGAGEGAFTLALADLLGAGATIHAVDRDAGSLATNARRVVAAFPAVDLVTIHADFIDALPLDDGSLDGLVMANSLHFVRDKTPVLGRIVRALRPGGRFILVEYGSDRGNPWVPFPLSFERWMRLAVEVGLVGTQRIGEVPSRFLGSIYAAASTTPDGPGVRPDEGGESPVLHSGPHDDDREE
jgi:ubiquinone/menaquinone biosynthesis C-methylase UbiE